MAAPIRCGDWGEMGQIWEGAGAGSIDTVRLMSTLTSGNLFLVYIKKNKILTQIFVLQTSKTDNYTVDVLTAREKKIYSDHSSKALKAGADIGYKGYGFNILFKYEFLL